MALILSDGEPVELTRLLPWAVDGLRREHLGDDFSFLYRFKVLQPSGRVVNDWIDTADLLTEPQPPDSDDPGLWVNYRYQTDAWQWKQEHVTPRLREFEKARRSYVVQQQPDEVRARLKTPGDYALVIAHAPVAEVTIGLIAEIAGTRFRFSFDDLGLIEAMEKYGLIKSGEASSDGYDLCRGWEADAMLELGEQPDQYYSRDVTDRAFVVWTMIRKDIWQGLNMERDRIRRGGR